MNDFLSSSLSHYFRRMLGPDRAVTPAGHLLHGANCVRPSDLVSLRALLPEIRAKAAGITDLPRLVQRIDLLLYFAEEASPDATSPAQREVAFVLYYFLMGNDLIPDNLPEIGLLDDALLVEAAILRNQHALETHWSERGRPWPEQP